MCLWVLIRRADDVVIRGPRGGIAQDACLVSIERATSTASVYGFTAS